jgi:hypothetical protein
MGKHKLNQQRTVVNKPAALFFRLPSSVCKWGEALLDQQMWCWGYLFPYPSSLAYTTIHYTALKVLLSIP